MKPFDWICVDFTFQIVMWLCIHSIEKEKKNGKSAKVPTILLLCVNNSRFESMSRNYFVDGKCYDIFHVLDDYKSF
jgi:hypothetical protein